MSEVVVLEEKQVTEIPKASYVYRSNIYIETATCIDLEISPVPAHRTQNKIQAEREMPSVPSSECLEMRNPQGKYKYASIALKSHPLDYSRPENTHEKKLREIHPRNCRRHIQSFSPKIKTKFTRIPFFRPSKAVELIHPSFIFIAVQLHEIIDSKLLR